MVTETRARPLPSTARHYMPATFQLTGWRYMGIEAACELAMVLGGGPLLFLALAGANAMSNRRRRQEAARLAAPRWRPLGLITVVVAKDRLLVLHNGAWASVWFDAITAVQSPYGGAVTLAFVHDPPYAFTGPQAWHLASALHQAMVGLGAEEACRCT